jgi:hypothetical protein
VSGKSINEILSAWAKRHGLRISDNYKNRFFYFDIADDAGGRYEISVFEDEQPGFHKVRATSNRRWSCGFIGVRPSDLEGILEQAYSKVNKWVEQAGGRKISAE